MIKKEPLKLSTILLRDLIKTNALLSGIIESQQRENEMLTFKMQGWLDWERHRKKFTNKKYLRKEH
jgi:hypothetical protein